jgi:uncharacterized cupredoxin-like copper-binding protein
MRRPAAQAALALGMGAVLVACSPQAAERPGIPESADRVLELSMEGMSFIPDRLEVRADETIAFVINNPNDIPHEVFIGDLGDQDMHRAAHTARAAAEQHLIPHMGTGIYLAAHGTAIVTFHFAEAGEILIGCHLTGHWEAGMVATVNVTP